jgi:hypothetical protein
MLSNKKTTNTRRGNFRDVNWDHGDKHSWRIILSESAIHFHVAKEVHSLPAENPRHESRDEKHGDMGCTSLESSPDNIDSGREKQGLLSAMSIAHPSYKESTKDCTGRE